jgi:hypothetical protein
LSSHSVCSCPILGRTCTTLSHTLPNYAYALVPMNAYAWDADDEDEISYKPGYGKFIAKDVNTSSPPQMATVQIPEDSGTSNDRKRRLKAVAPASSLSVETRKQKAVKPNHMCDV